MTEECGRNHEFTVVLVTLLRNQAMRRAIVAWREISKSVPILVVDQNGTTKNADFYNEMNVKALFLPYNSGLSTSRNATLLNVQTEFMFMCDDDQVPLMGIEDINKALEAAKRQEVAFTGAEVTLRYDTADPTDLHYAYTYEVTEGVLVMRQIFPIKCCSDDNEVILAPADVVANAGLINVRTLLALNCRWDEQILIGHEHIDFFLNAKNRGLRSAYSPILHMGEPTEHRRPLAYGKLRSHILPSKQYVSRKWGLSHIVRFETSSGAVHVTPLDMQYEWPSLLTKVATSLDHIACKWWLSNGTLLGLERDRGFIPHTTDMDVTASTSLAGMFRLNHHLRRQRLRVEHYRGNLRVGFEWTVAPHQTEVATHCDIFFVRGRPGHYVQARFAGTEVGQYEYAVRDVKYETTPLTQRPLPVPVGSDVILAEEYGSQWGTPQVDWDWLASPLNRLPSRRHIGVAQFFWGLSFRTAALPFVLRASLQHFLQALARVTRSLARRSLLARGLIRAIDRHAFLRDRLARIAGL